MCVSMWPPHPHSVTIPCPRGSCFVKLESTLSEDASTQVTACNYDAWFLRKGIFLSVLFM